MLTTNQRDVLAALITVEHAHMMADKELQFDLLILYELIRKHIEEADAKRSEYESNISD